MIPLINVEVTSVLNVKIIISKFVKNVANITLNETKWLFDY